MSDADLDAFARLGLPRRFDLDRAEIEAAYLSRALLAHPDLSEPSADTARAAAELNDAYAALLEPERRAEALLRARCGAVADDTLAPGFLMEMLEAREAMDAELASDPKRAAWWRAWVGEKRGTIIARVASLFQAMPERPSVADARAVRRELNAWRYLERMLERLEDAG